LKSSTGKYYVGLDHIRGIAAFMVFTWHFIHVHDGHRAAPPVFPLSLLTEGHTGVALFMTLSGYLFAKLLDGKRVSYPSFLWNRILRLAPLLIFVTLLAGCTMYYANGLKPIDYSLLVLSGLVLPTLPNGGWSITVEFHFYLILPFLLFLSRRSTGLLFLFILGMLVLRTVLYLEIGQVQWYAYWTILGRVDQFILGILGYQFRDVFKGRHVLALGVFLCFAGFYRYVDALGGFYSHFPRTSPDSVWIYLTTIEGLAYGALIAWYDNSFVHTTGRISRFLALIGTYSYSIYLLHIFFVFKIAEFTDKHLVDLSNIYVALLLSPIAFLLILPIAAASYRFIELPFLRFRTNYIVADKDSLHPAAQRDVAR
jgi:peptidoglycan/LPS O-acetylase OafA/YrhL